MADRTELTPASPLDGVAIAALANIFSGALLGSANAAEAPKSAAEIAQIEKETARVGSSFMKAWERPEADELVEFFAIPCEIKYGHALDLSYFTSREQLLEMLTKTISDDRVWYFEPITTWVRGTLMIHDCYGNRRAPKEPAPAERSRLIFLTNIIDGRIRQWVDIGYFDVVA